MPLIEQHMNLGSLLYKRADIFLSQSRSMIVGVVAMVVVIGPMVLLAPVFTLSSHYKISLNTTHSPTVNKSIKASLNECKIIRNHHLILLTTDEDFL